MTASSVTVERAVEATEELRAAVERLLPQVSSSAAPPTLAVLAEIIAAPGTALLVARDAEVDGAIVGSLTLATYRTPSGLHAIVEDVVVDETSRGRGTGEALVRHALALARSLGAKNVDLSSRPSREAANRLYQRLGFEPRATNLYRFKLT